MKKRLLLILLITIISSLALPMTAMAEVKEETGIKVERSVEVLSGDKIEVTLTASAKESYDLSDVMLVNQTPKGYRVVSGDTTLTTDEIKSGDTEKLVTVFGKDVNTGDVNGSRLMLYGLVAVLSIVLALIILRKTKRINKALMLILCFSLIGTGALAVSGTAFATSNSEIKLSKEVTVRNEQVTVDSIVNYGMVSENTGVLTYDANGHGTAPEAVTMKYAVETKAASALSETGYTFEEWNTSADGKGTSYAAGSVVKAADETARDTKLYAIWKEKTAVLTYVDSGVTTTEDMKYSEATTLKTPTKEGYEFQGWTTKEDGTGDKHQAKEVIKAANVEPTAITLYAQWKECKAKAILTSGKTLYFVYDSNEYKVNGNYKVSDTNYETINAVYDVPTSSSMTSPAAWIFNSDIVTAKFEDSFANFKPTTTVGWFAYCENLSSIKNIDNINTSKLTDVSAMFYEAGTAVDHLNWDLSNWNLPHVTNMTSTFQGVGKNSTTVKLNLSNLKAPNNTSLYATFHLVGQYAKKSINIDVSGWETGSVNTMDSTFDRVGAEVNDVDGNEEPARIIESVTITGLDKWDTSNVTNMFAVFTHAGRSASSFNIGDLSKWDTAKVENMEAMFASAGKAASSFNIGNLANWKTSNVTDMRNMFCGAGASASTYNIGDLSNWNTSNVTDMRSMFNCAGSSASSFNIGDLSNWKTSNVTDMQGMFHNAGYSASSFNIGDLSNWKTSNVTDMQGMFSCAGYSASSFNIGNLANWNTSNVTDMRNMFRCAGYSASSFNIGNLANWNTSNVTDMSYLFAWAGFSASGFNIGNLANWNTSNVTDMSYMFACAGYSASSFSIGKLDSWKTANVTNMSNMFRSAGRSASSFNIGNLANWNTSNVTDMSYMFAWAGEKAYGNWNVGNIGSWNVEKVTTMRAMFTSATINARKSCIPDGFIKSLKDWNTISCKDFSWMFYGCYNETGTIDLTKWVVSSVTNGKDDDGNDRSGFSHMFCDCCNIEKVDMSTWKTSEKVPSYQCMFDDCYALKEVDFSGINVAGVCGPNQDGYGIAEMIDGGNHLEKITLGVNFKFTAPDGKSSWTLPTPSSTYIPGATGKWYNAKTGEAYTPAELKNYIDSTYGTRTEAITFVAVPPTK